MLQILVVENLIARDRGKKNFVLIPPDTNVLDEPDKADLSSAN